jgi:hypothetical protein
MLRRYRPCFRRRIRYRRSCRRWTATTQQK